MRLSRRESLAGAGALVLASALPTRAAGDWVAGRPEDLGFAADLAERIDGLARGRNVHGVLVVRDGRIAAERYFEGTDQSWGRDLGRVAFGPGTLHDLRSVSKSIVGLLYGAALTEGKVPGPDERLHDHFPEYPDLVAEPERRRIKIRHVLTMTMGTDWNESVPYTSPANSEIAMEMAPDRIRFILERPIVGEPGLRWTYSGGATALLGRLVEKGTGRNLGEYARMALFDPLGIGPTEWRGGRDGPSAASGLRMTPRDLARIGRLILDGGLHDGRRIVSPDWLEDSFRSHAVSSIGGYGYQWYGGNFPVGAETTTRDEAWIGAFGNGGQRLFVVPGIRLIIVVTAGNYNEPGQAQAPIAIVRNAILPSLRLG